MIILLVTNIELLVTTIKKNNNEKLSKKYIISGKYMLLTIASSILIFLLYYTEQKIVFFRKGISFINSVINDGLNRLPLEFIFVWIGLPLLVCYVTLIARGFVYYQKKKNSYNRHLKSNTSSVVNFKELITVKSILTIKDFRKVIREAKLTPQYAQFENFDWIIIGDKKQLGNIDRTLNIPDISKYPAILRGKNNNWEILSQNDALKIVRNRYK